MAQPPYRTTPEDIDHMPAGVPFIVGNEAAERFSYYGMKAILMTYMTKYLCDAAGGPAHMSEDAGKEAIAWFGAAVYATPFLGAIVSDWLWGKYNTILWVSLLYCVGHAVLALLEFPGALGIDPRWILFGGLALIAFGAGGIKPCVSANVGDQFGPRNKHLLPKVYGWFYFSINLGSFASMLLTPWLLRHYGAGWAFGVPGILMGIATIVFWMGRHKFVHIPPSGDRFWTDTFSLRGLLAIAHLVPLLLFVAVFWSIFDQTHSAWVAQAEKMDRVVIGCEIEAAQLQAVNPVMVMFMIPAFAYGVYPAIGALVPFTPLRRIGVGLFLTAAAFAISGWIQMRIDAGEVPSIGWQVVAYLVLTAAEILVSITMLEFFYTQAPPSMKSLVMAFNLLSVSIGNVLTAVVNNRIQNADGTSKLPGDDYYWFFTGLMLVTAVVYLFWAPWYRGRSYVQGEATA